jgi:DNA-directed RNA polymerase subunit RPC12/RpoP
MKKENDPKIQTAKWFMDFLFDDFDNMSELDLAKRVMEVQFYFFRSKDWTHNPQSSNWHRQDGFMVHDVFAKESNYPWRNNLKHIQAVLKKELSSMDPEWPSGSFVEALSDIRYYWGIENRKIFAGYEIDPDTTYYYELKRLEKIATMTFFNALDGISIDAIKNCQECGKYFLHLSKKPKYFCSPKCTSRAISRKRRKENPQKYQEYQRAVMRDKYRIEKGLKPKKFYKDRTENGGK